MIMFFMNMTIVFCGLLPEVQMGMAEMQKSIASDFNVTKAMVCRINVGTGWGWLTGRGHAKVP
jgi:hypothetical protein